MKAYFFLYTIKSKNMLYIKVYIISYVEELNHSNSSNMYRSIYILLRTSKIIVNTQTMIKNYLSLSLIYFLKLVYINY